MAVGIELILTACMLQFGAIINAAIRGAEVADANLEDVLNSVLAAVGWCALMCIVLLSVAVWMGRKGWHRRSPNSKWELTETGLILPNLVGFLMLVLVFVAAEG